MASNSRSTAKNRVNNDPVDELKRKSRRRLVGSIALFLAAIIIVPALVETEPSQTPSKVELVVPERPSADLGPDQAPAAPTQAPTQAPSAGPAESAPVPNKPVPEAQVAVPPLAPKAELKAEPKPEVKPEPKPVLKPEPKLEPKPEPKAEAKPAPTKTEDDLIAKFAKEGEGVYWVQVAAVADKARAEALRKELSGKGYSSKVEPVSNNGSTVYRVRVGPINSQDKADSTKAQLGSAGYQGRVVQ